MSTFDEKNDEVFLWKLVKNTTDRACFYTCTNRFYIYTIDPISAVPGSGITSWKCSVITATTVDTFEVGDLHLAICKCQNWERDQEFKRLFEKEEE